ncbi:MAG: SpaH/EbpB family LPXTG-anchored major pilin [Actinomycetia bacterium]|nr:SpaH/EbpB family LPXTG-anchored major pilin [Actinomycetes bacterium]
MAAAACAFWAAFMVLPGGAAASETAIPSDADGSLTIHKLLGPVLDRNAFPATGAPIELPATAEPVPGVEFTVTRVDGVDLTTQAGLDAAQEYLGDIAAARANLGEQVATGRTAADGTLRVPDLATGLYLVHESGAFAEDGTENPRLVGGPDFLVTVPTQHPVTNEWIYDVHVYPKNSSVDIVKTVADGNPGSEGQDAPTAGHRLTYTLTTDIPHDGLRTFGGQCVRDGDLDTGAALDEHGFTADGWCARGADYDPVGAAYEILDDLASAAVPGTDRFASDYLEFRNADWPGHVQVSLAGDTLEQCTSGTDDDCHYTLTLTPERAAIAMTATGLEALASAKRDDAAAQVTVTIEAQVREAVVSATTQSAGDLRGGVPAVVLEIPNTAILIPTGPSKETGHHVPSNPVRTIYSTLKVHKVDAADGADLAGAVFTLYRTLADARAERSPLAVSAPTDSAGMTQLPGLHVNDIQNDGPASDTYWLVETTVPDGYTATGEPIQVRVLSDGRTEGADISLGVPVPNYPEGMTPPPVTPPPGETPPGETPPGQTPPDTPGKPSIPDRLAQTGAEVLTVLFVGALLVMGGMTLVRATRRRRDAASGAD